MEKSPVGGFPVTSVAPFVSPGATVTVTSVFPLRVEEVTPAKPVVTVTVWVVPSTTTSGDTDSSMPVSASFMYISLRCILGMLAVVVPPIHKSSLSSVTASSTMVRPFKAA